MKAVDKVYHIMEKEVKQWGVVYNFLCRIFNAFCDFQTCISFATRIFDQRKLIAFVLVVKSGHSYLIISTVTERLITFSVGL